MNERMMSAKKINDKVKNDKLIQFTENWTTNPGSIFPLNIVEKSFETPSV